MLYLSKISNPTLRTRAGMIAAMLVLVLPVVSMLGTGQSHAGTRSQGVQVQGTQLQDTRSQGTQLQGTRSQGTLLQGTGHREIDCMGEPGELCGRDCYAITGDCRAQISCMVCGWCSILSMDKLAMMTWGAKRLPAPLECRLPLWGKM